MPVYDLTQIRLLEFSADSEHSDQQSPLEPEPLSGKEAAAGHTYQERNGGAQLFNNTVK